MSFRMTGRKVAGLAALVALAACAESPTAPSMEAPGELNFAKLSDFQCKSNAWARSFTSTGASFSSQKACTAYAKSGGSISTLEIVNSSLTETEEGLLWSLDVRGINLQPGSVITLVNGIHNPFPAANPVPANGFGSASFGFYCAPAPQTWGTMHAVAVLPSGATVGSNRVTTLCPEG